MSTYARTIGGLLAAAASFGAAACEPVTSVPATLSNGVFCLVGDIAAGGQPAVTLLGDATLDCQGHRISDATLATVNAVVVSGDNVEVRNCIVEGFLTPFRVLDATHFRIRRNTFLSPMNTAIYVEGQQGLIADNTIRYPGSRIAGYSAAWHNDASGITLVGNADVLRNTISSASPAAGSLWRSRYGIFASTGVGSVIAFNVITGLIPDPLHRRIALLASGTPVVYRNVIVSPPTSLAAANDVGIQCSQPSPDPAVVLQNIVVGYHRPYWVC